MSLEVSATSRFTSEGSWNFVEKVVSCFRRVRFNHTELLNLSPFQNHDLSSRNTRVPIEYSAFAVEIGTHRRYIYQDRDIHNTTAQSSDFMILDPDRYFSGMGQFQRLRSNRKIQVRFADGAHRMSSIASLLGSKHRLQVRHEGDSLVFTTSRAKPNIRLSVLSETGDAQQVVNRRRQSLDRVLEIFGGPIETLEPRDGMALLRAVNEQMSESQHRPIANDGKPGGVVRLPDRVTPILIGDLHACVDNLLRILSENATMKELDQGNAAIVFLGDAVHPEAADSRESMCTSVLIMDLILKLMHKYPDQVFFLIGNHDSFSEEVTKCGTPQGRLWAEHLRKVRGEEYCTELQRFYNQSPRIAVSEDFVACHGGPPRARITNETLINLREFPQIEKELTWNRLKTQVFPSGYGRSDVRRFRKALGLDKTIPFIVSHTPSASDETAWLNIGRIQNHHVVYSARTDKVGVFVRIDGQMVAQVYTAEPILGWMNERTHCSRLAESGENNPE